LSGFLVSQNSQRSSKKKKFEILASKKLIGNPDQQFSAFISADTYTGLLYYVIIRYLSRAQCIIAKFAPSS